jgi:molybdenum-dependent DNA-binding transcriptional regulator ModE
MGPSCFLTTAGIAAVRAADRVDRAGTRVPAGLSKGTARVKTPISLHTQPQPSSFTWQVGQDNRSAVARHTGSLLRSRGDGKAACCRQQTMIDLNSLAIFAKVAETRSFSEAARRLKLPISTVSRRVAELEDQLGVGLLERSTRNLRLTDIGRKFLSTPNAAGRSARPSAILSRINRLRSRASCGCQRHPAFPIRCWYRWSPPSRPPIPMCACKSW